MAPLILRARRAWVRLITGLALVVWVLLLVYTGRSEFLKTVTNPNYSCSKTAAGWPQQFSYLQLIVDSQRLREPVFDGFYFINLGSEFDQKGLELTIIQAGKSSYARTTHRPQLTTNQFNNLSMQDNATISLVSSSSHYMFPFDSANFRGSV